MIFASKFFPFSFAIFSVHEVHLIETGDIDRILAELYLNRMQFVSMFKCVVNRDCLIFAASEKPQAISPENFDRISLRNSSCFTNDM